VVVLFEHVKVRFATTTGKRLRESVEPDLRDCLPVAQRFKETTRILSSVRTVAGEIFFHLFSESGFFRRQLDRLHFRNIHTQLPLLKNGKM